eukprot:scaffold67708_cov44-Prasinocladus_malaysianus.AAC.2
MLSWPDRAAEVVVSSSQGQPLALAYCRIRRWPLRAAMAQVEASQLKPFSRSQCSVWRWPEPAASEHGPVSDRHLPQAVSLANVGEWLDSHCKTEIWPPLAAARQHFRMSKSSMPVVDSVLSSRSVWPASAAA